MYAITVRPKAVRKVWLCSSVMFICGDDDEDDDDDADVVDDDDDVDVMMICSCSTRNFSTLLSAT